MQTVTVHTAGYRAGKNRFLPFLGFKLTDAGHKITTYKQRFGHVNATVKIKSHLNIVCIKLVIRVRKKN